MIVFSFLSPLLLHVHLGSVCQFLPNNLVDFFFLMFVFSLRLLGRQNERERAVTPWFAFQKPATASPRSKWHQEPGIQSGSLLWMTGTRLLEPLPAGSQSAQWQKVRTRHKARTWIQVLQQGCEHHRWWLNSKLKRPALLEFLKELCWICRWTSGACPS